MSAMEDCGFLNVMVYFGQCNVDLDWLLRCSNPVLQGFRIQRTLRWKSVVAVAVKPVKTTLQDYSGGGALRM